MHMSWGDDTMTSRREFLRRSTFALSTLGMATLPNLSQAFGQIPSERLSIGETFVFPQWLAAMAAVAEGSRQRADRAFWGTLQTRLSVLDQLRDRALAADALNLITLPAPGVEPFEVALARRLSMLGNDQLAQSVDAAGGRLAGLATISAFDPLAVREADRAITGLKLAGLNLGANRGLRLDHPALRPIYEFAAATRVPLYLPAAYTSIGGDAPYRVLGTAGVITGAAADSGGHLTQLIYGGVLDAYPSLTVIMARLGEGTPYWYGEMHDTYTAIERSGGSLPRRPIHEYFRDNILLTTTDMTPQTLKFCSAMLGDGRVLLSHEHARSRVNIQNLTGLEASQLLRRA
jgi:predicted TIM-barrel fold metal-dependent hydrolase